MNSKDHCLNEVEQIENCTGNNSGEQTIDPATTSEIDFLWRNSEALGYVTPRSKIKSKRMVKFR